MFFSTESDLNSQLNEFRFPPGCTDICEYQAKWQVVGNELEVIVTGYPKDGDWIGFGFSKTKFMPNTDVVLGYIDQQGNSVVKDFDCEGFYIPPVLDESQDITETSLVKKVCLNLPFKLIFFLIILQPMEFFSYFKYIV